MADSQRIHLTGMARLKTNQRWLALTAFSLVFIAILHYIHIPGYLLIGAMMAGVVMSLGGGPVRVPLMPLYLSQSFVGCMIGRSVSMELIHDVKQSWPLFVLMVGSVSIVAFILGWLLVKSQKLPGTTGIWGCSPGAALIMTVMSENYGADSRLVALMQYSRVMLVSLIATVVAGLWAQPVAAAGTAAMAVAPVTFDWIGFGQTCLLALAGMSVGKFLKMSSGPILVPLIIGSILNVTGIIHIVLPPALLAVAYGLIGWSIGLRFTRQIVLHAFRALPYIVATIVVLIVVCGAFAAFLAGYAGIDPLVAYLATSPGGMDAIAIISASMAPQDMSFIMAVQVCRFILVSLTSPPLASYLVKKMGIPMKRDSARF